MVNEIEEKKKLIKEIDRCFDEIEYWRKNFVFEEELPYEKVKQLDLKLGQLWLTYLRLYEDISSKL